MARRYRRRRSRNTLNPRVTYKGVIHPRFLDDVLWPEFRPSIARGKRMLEFIEPEPIAPGAWSIRSERHDGRWVVHQTDLPRYLACTCPHFQSRGVLCKHTVAMSILLGFWVEEDDWFYMPDDYEKGG